MAAKFNRKSWFRLKPFIAAHLIVPPIWFAPAESLKPLTSLGHSADQKHNRNLRELFPEEKDRLIVDVKVRVVQDIDMFDSNQEQIFGRAVLAKELSHLFSIGIPEKLSWTLALRTLRNKHKLNVEHIEEQVRVEKMVSAYHEKNKEYNLR